MRKGYCLILSILLLLVGLTGCDDRGSNVYDLDASRIRTDTVYLCREIGIRVTGSEKEKQTADWITDKLRDAGFTEEKNCFRTEFRSAQDLDSENVMAICNPESEGPIFSVVAHYDSVSTSLGARDNAASVAALLEMARYLGADNSNYPCQIRLVFLGSEENGYHGAKAYVESLTDAERERHMGAFNMDISAASDGEDAQLVCNTLGAGDRDSYQKGNFIIPAEGKLTDAIREAYRELYGKELGGVFHFGESDHVRFHDAGLEAVNVCWRKVSGNMPVLPASYHKMEDTPEELNYETVRSSARSILKAIEILSHQ